MNKIPYNRTVTIIKQQNDGNWISYDDLIKACQLLNGAALKLFIYFTSYESGHVLKISPQYICPQIGISLNSERNAFVELQLKGYLTEEEKGYYIFNPTKNHI